jgi:hypothetical protein
MYDVMFSFIYLINYKNDQAKNEKLYLYVLPANFHIWTVPSADPVISTASSGCHQRTVSCFLCPLRVLTQLSVCKSQILFEQIKSEE